MTHDNRTHTRISRLVHQAAEHAAPADLDLWPGIAAQVMPRPAAPARHRRGALTLVAALLIVIAAALAFSLLRDRDGDPLHVASLNQNPTPTVSPNPATLAPPEAPAADPYALCRRYPQFCMPYVGGVERSHPLARVETPNNPVARQVEVRSSGVVRGLTADGLPVIGNPAAPAHVEVISDFACPHCWAFHEGDLLRFIDEYVLTGQATVQLRLIDSIHADYSPVAAQAALCAGEQNALWEMTDQVMTTSRRLSEADYPPDAVRTALVSAADDLGLDSDALLACVSSGRYDAVIADYRQGAEAIDIAGVPSVLFADAASGEWTQIMASYESMADFTALASDYPGQQMLDTVQIQPDDFADEATYTHSGTLTRNDPREDYHLEGGGQLLEALDASDGWVLFSVSGDAFTPYLYVDQNLYDTTPMLHNYRTGDGALLVNWMDGVPGADRSLYHQVYYNIIVDGHITTLIGDYTLTVQPVTDVVPLTDDPAPLTVPARQPIVAQFDAPEGTLVSLDVRVGHTDDPTVAESYPPVAVLLPNGRTLTTFDPNETYTLRLSFVAPPAGEQFLVFNPLVAPTPGSVDPVALRVSAAAGRVVSDVPILEPSDLPEGTVAVTVPMVDSSESARLDASVIGQLVDVFMTLPYADAGEGIHTRMPNDAELIVTDADNLAVTIVAGDASAPITVTRVTHRVIRDARALGVGFYFVPTDAGDSRVWLTEAPSTVITLAVSPEDALVLTWAIDAGVPIQIMLADD